MNRRLLVLWLIAAVPAVLCAQGNQPAACRTLEEAGNFVGPDEVIDGNRVCPKAKPGVASLGTNGQENPQPDAIPPAEPPMGVAEAARRNRKKSSEPKENATSVPAAAPAAAVLAPVTAAEYSHLNPSLPETTSAIRAAPSASAAKLPDTEPAAAPARESATPSPLPAVSPSRETPAPGATRIVHAAPSASAAKLPDTEPAAAPARELATPGPAPAVSPSRETPARGATRVVRDAPVAAGTPSEPPEKDYGFSDANAVEPPAAANSAPATSSPAAAAAPRNRVELGAFAASKENGAPDDRRNLAEGSRPECTKNITLGGFEGQTLVVGRLPSAEAWIGKNRKALPNLCFSGGPIGGAENYLIVFYVNEPSSDGKGRMPLPDSAITGTFAVNGRTWQYSPSADPPVRSRDAVEQSSNPGNIWYATAYAEDGAAVAERWPEGAKPGDNERVFDELLTGIVRDLLKR